MHSSIAEKICELRKARSLTQDKLGSMLGISSQAVSKWEKGESLPDITLLPRLCEILGITADALLEVPATVQKDSCMHALSNYAREVGESKALFEAMQACSCVTSDWKGSAQTSNRGSRINNTKGLGLVISGEEMMNAIKRVDWDAAKRIGALLGDEHALKVFGALDFTEPRSEEEIAAQCGLSLEETNLALFRLMKMNVCECFIDGKFLMGVQAYVVFAVLAGVYLASAEGHQDIYSISRDYNN